MAKYPAWRSTYDWSLAWQGCQHCWPSSWVQTRPRPRPTQSLWWQYWPLDFPRLAKIITTLTQHSAHISGCAMAASEWLDRHWITGARLAPGPDPGLGTWPVPGLSRRNFPLWGAREQRRSPSRLRRHPDEPSAMRWTLGSRLCVSLSSLTLTKPKSLTAKSPPWLLAASKFLSSKPESQVAPV